MTYPSNLPLLFKSPGSVSEAIARFNYQPENEYENLAPVPEPTQLSDLSSYNGVTVSANGVEFAGTPAASDYAYEDHNLIAGLEYRLAMYVEMGDESEPVPGDDSSTGDFSMIADGIIRTGAAVSASGDGYLVVVTWTQEQDSAGADYGIIQYAAQSDKACTTTKYHILRTAYCSNYTYINNDNFGAVRANHPKNRLMSDGIRRCLTSTPYGDQNFVANGGFETAGGGGADIWGSWTETVSDGALANETTEVHAGSDACKITAGSSVDTEVEQTFAVVAGRRYRLSMWARGDATYGGRYSVYDESNTADIVAITATGVTAAAYSQVTKDFIAPSGCSSVSVHLWCPSTDTGVCYFDDVSIVALEDHLEFGEATALEKFPASATTFPAETRYDWTGTWTHEAGQTMYLRPALIDANNRVFAGSTSGDDLDVVVVTPGGGFDRLFQDVDFFSGGEVYKLRMRGDLSTGELEVWVNGVSVFSTANEAVATGPGTPDVVHTLASNDLVVTTKALNAPGAFCRGGEGSWGTPWLGIADGNGDAFAFDENYLTQITVTPLAVAGNFANVGIDNNTNGQPKAPYWAWSGANLSISIIGADPVVGTITAGEQEVFELLYLGDRVNCYREVNGQRQLTWTDTQSPQATGYLAISTYSAAFNINSISLSNLQPSLGTEDFSTITDSKSSPVTTTTFDVNSDGEISAVFTHETGKDFNIFYRYNEEANSFLLQTRADGGLKLRYRVGGDLTTLFDVAGLFSDGVEYTVAISFNGGVHRVFVNSVLLTEQTAAGILTSNTGGKVVHNLASNDIELSTHPYPGLVPQYVTDRVPSPQEDAAFIHHEDAVLEIALNWLNTGTDFRVDFRKTDDANCWRLQANTADDSISLYLVTSGTPALKASSGAGSLTNGALNTIRLKFVGNIYDAWIGGTAAISSYEDTGSSHIDRMDAHVEQLGNSSVDELIAWRVRPSLGV